MEASIFVELMRGIDPGHPLLIAGAYLLFLAWQRGKWPFKQNGNGNGKAAMKRAEDAHDRIDSHEAECVRRHDANNQRFQAVNNRIDRFEASAGKRFDKLEDDVGDVKESLARVEGYLSARKDAHD